MSIVPPPHLRAATTSYVHRPPEQIQYHLRPTLSRASLQSGAGDYCTRADLDRELDLKRRWVDAKRTQEARQAEYRAALEQRFSRAKLPRIPTEETLAQETELVDSDQIDWGENDPENPQNFPFWRKVRITALAILLTINVTFASSAPSSGIPAIQRTFSVSREASLLITSIFLCGFVAGPVIWGPLSELFGRRPVFIFTLLFYTLFQLGQSLGTSFATVIVTRFFAGLFAAAPLTNSGGIMVDVWDPIARGRAMALFSGSVFIGPVMGPIVGGFVVNSSLGWRWIFWLLMIFSGTCWILIVFFLPETYGPILLAKRARRMRKEDPEKNRHKYAPAERVDFSPRALLERTVYRPFIMLAHEPILVLVTIYLSIVYGLLYSLFSVFPIIWQQMRGFNPGQGGLVFIGVGLGTTVGAALSIYLQRHYRVLVPMWHGSPPPEERLFGAMLAGPFLVVGIFWLGWTGAYRSVPWYVPALATIPLGVSFTLIFVSYLSYIVDTYLLFAASALAANTIFRSAVGAAFPLFTTQMYSALGVQWACTLVGCVAILLAPIPFVFYKYGPKIRERSKFAPCVDIKIRDQVEEEQRLERERADQHTDESV